MIQAVIFDCFGVLCSDGLLPFRERMFGADQAKHAEAVRLNREVDAGRLKYDDFIDAIALLAGVPRASAKREIEHNVPNEQIFALIKQLQQTYKIGMLSNAGENWLYDIFLPEQVELFDEIVLSCDIKIVKPEPGAYQAIAAKLGLAPSECVFVDDQPKYVAGAKAVGMSALLFTDTSTLQLELESLLTF